MDGGFTPRAELAAEPGGITIRAEPYAWPILGPVDPAKVALVMIDMQVDFVKDDGWFSSTGFDLRPIQLIVPTVAVLLAAARQTPGLNIVHTRQGTGDLADLPRVRVERATRFGTPYGRKGPYGRGLIRGEAGWDFIEEAAPAPGEKIVDKAGYSAFHGTDLHEWLRGREVASLILAGVTVNVCVLSTLLAAIDRGYDCVTVADATAGVTAETTRSVLDMVRYQGGIFGAVAAADDVISALRSGVAA